MAYNNSDSSSGGTKIVNYSLFSLSDIGIITGIVLCILQACNVLNIGWFWATFPFWIVPAVWIAIFLLAWIILGIIAIIVYIKDKE